MEPHCYQPLVDKKTSLEDSAGSVASSQGGTGIPKCLQYRTEPSTDQDQDCSLQRRPHPTVCTDTPLSPGAPGNSLCCPHSQTAQDGLTDEHTGFPGKLKPHEKILMVPSNDLEALPPTCGRARTVLLPGLQSRRTVFPVTVKKSSSARARSASSNMSLVIAFGEEQRAYLWSCPTQTHNEPKFRNHWSLLPSGRLDTHFMLQLFPQGARCSAPQAWCPGLCAPLSGHKGPRKGCQESRQGLVLTSRAPAVNLAFLITAKNCKHSKCPSAKYMTGKARDRMNMSQWVQCHRAS